MSNCYFCYQPVDTDRSYHPKCCKRFFGSENLPVLELNKDLLLKLANTTVHQRISLTGVQPKLSVSLSKGERGARLTIVGLWGDYILKPQHTAIDHMPEVEDLTMHLAKSFRIDTCAHTLLPASNGDLVYLARRFDRLKKIKIHMEDFCQLAEFQTEQKYNSTYERCGKLIQKYCHSVGLDLLNYFEILVFSFLSGNNDMHMKNFSVLHLENEIKLAPAYDLTNGQLINPKDKEDMALQLNGRKKRISRHDFEQLATVLGISPVVCNRVLKKFTTEPAKVFELIDQSFLTDDYKAGYKKIWTSKLEILRG